jgi:hypothetical protein
MMEMELELIMAFAIASALLIACAGATHERRSTL